ncbi:E3 ubiquitin ligase PQT3-like isoform X2 [Beta vulgaris subsp. vulgaris]|uniref:E3 ubiquitin ligase PQT3-like isoform X2 n=1 Tax=Beta vulgaris subsp. vulgaris TaxID=3555 RepID=UPI0020371C2B|nr:E3 ubiquitin ligase PQT3-like isoform X2 [Beta vulgaris subsp. vulgaris]
MAVYYKFKSSKVHDSISIDGLFISVNDLKQRIIKSKSMERGTPCELIVTNAQTNEEYLDEARLIPRHTSVLIRRVPRVQPISIVIQPNKPKVETQVQDDQPAFEASELDDEFGSSIYATTPCRTPGQSSSTLQDSVPPTKADEDSKIKALVENSGFDWQNHRADGFGRERGFGRGGQSGRGVGQAGFGWKTPPQGYVCHRCKVPGHYIQHCPTNGDPNYDVKKLRPPTGIPKSMLVPKVDGSYALPSGTSAVLKLNETAFDKAMEGLPSTRSLRHIPPELHCPLCKEVMKDAVFSSKCCFDSFCDKCIRDYIISKSMCVCEARDILADYLVPNKTLRDTIDRMLESGDSSVDNTGGALQVQDMESARCPQPRVPSPIHSAASKGEEMLLLDAKETTNVKENVDGSKPRDALQQQVQPQTSGEGKITKVEDVSEVTHDTVKEPASHDNALPVEEEVQQKMAAFEAAADAQWMNMQPGMDGYMSPSAFQSCWPGVQPTVDAFMGPFDGSIPHNMGMPMNMAFGNFMAPDPFGAQWFMMPQMLPLPPRDLTEEFGVNMSVRPLLLSKEEPESRKAEVRRKRKMPRRMERDPSKDRECSREARSNANVLPMISEYVCCFVVQIYVLHNLDLLYCGSCFFCLNLAIWQVKISFYLLTNVILASIFGRFLSHTSYIETREFWGNTPFVCCRNPFCTIFS